MCLSSTHNLMPKTASRDFMFAWNNTNENMFTWSVFPYDVKHLLGTQNSLPGTKGPEEWNLSFQMCNCINLQRCKSGTFQSALHHQHSLRWPCWITTSEVKRNVFEELLHLQDITVSSRSKKEKEKKANTRLFHALCLIIQGSLLKPHMISSQKGSPQPLGQRMQHFTHTHL